MGLEYISQPQVFLAPITAVNGIQGISNPLPLLTTYQSWVSTGVVNTSAFPIPGAWTMLDESGSFIVTIGNVIQSPTDYSIDRTNRILTFSSIITAGIEVGVTQLATAAPSSATFKNLTAENLFVYDTAFVNNVSLSSGTIIGSSSETVFSDGSVFTGNGNNTLTLNYLNGVFVGSNFTVASAIRGFSVSATNAATTSLSSRFINLEHSTPNDGINPVLFIGERGDGSGGTVAGSLSGYNISYNEQNNDLLVTTQFGSVTPLTAIDINNTGFVGIGGNPNSRLTVVGDVSATGSINVNGYNATSIPLTTATAVIVPVLASTVIFTGATTVTLPAASLFPGRWLDTKVTAANIINSATSNVAPLTGTTPNNIILPQTGTAAQGKWARLQSDGTNWVVIAAN